MATTVDPSPPPTSHQNQPAAEMVLQQTNSTSAPNSPKTPPSVSSNPEDHDMTKRLSPVEAVRKWPWISTWIILLSSGIILTGFDISIISNVASLPEFQMRFGQAFGDRFIIPALWLGIWNASVPIGSIAGSLFGGYFQDLVGRRGATAAGSLLSTACVAAAFFADMVVEMDGRRGIFLAAKLMQGFGNGMMICVIETYMSEVLPPALRGPGIALYPIFTLLGQLLGAVVVQACIEIKGTLSYRVAFATQWPFTIAPLIVAIFLPESPVWLVRMEKFEAAGRSLLRLSSAADAPNVPAELEELKRTIQMEREQSEFRNPTYIECFKGTDNRRSWIIMLARLIPMFFGLPLFSTASYFLQTLGVAPRVSVMFTLVGVVCGLISNVVSVWTLTSFGRRPLMMWSLGAAAVLWTSIGIAGCFPTTTAMQWYVAIGMMVTIVTVGVAAWPASHVVAVETSSLRLRALSQGMGGVAINIVSGALNVILPYIYNPDEGNAGARATFLLAFLTALSVVLTWFFIPEMKDRTAEMIDEMFELRLPARAFKGWERVGRASAMDDASAGPVEKVNTA